MQNCNCNMEKAGNDIFVIMLLYLQGIRLLETFPLNIVC